MSENESSNDVFGHGGIELFLSTECYNFSSTQSNEKLNKIKPKQTQKLSTERTRNAKKVVMGFNFTLFRFIIITFCYYLFRCSDREQFKCFFNVPFYGQEF